VFIFSCTYQYHLIFSAYFFLENYCYHLIRWKTIYRLFSGSLRAFLVFAIRMVDWIFLSKFFFFKLSKFLFSNCQNFPFSNCQNFSFSNCQNFSFQTLKIFFFKLSKFSFSNCQNFLFSNCQNFSFQTVKIPLFQTVKIFLSTETFSNGDVHIFSAIRFLDCFELNTSKYLTITLFSRAKCLQVRKLKQKCSTLVIS
jgi:hypothetical protein